VVQLQDTGGAQSAGTVPTQHHCNFEKQQMQPVQIDQLTVLNMAC
jgi:hypothetical protein